MNFHFAPNGKNSFGKFSLLINQKTENITKHFSIYRYAVVSRTSSVFIFGGRCDGEDSTRIAKYTLDQWTEVGNLKAARLGPSAISNDDRIYVVGGEGTFS